MEESYSTDTRFLQDADASSCDGNEIQTSSLSNDSQTEGNNNSKVSRKDNSFCELIMSPILYVLKKRYWLPWILLLIIVITAVDIWWFYSSHDGLHVHDVEVSFLPTSTAAIDAEMKINGSIAKASWTTTFDITEVKCSYFYQKDKYAKVELGGHFNWQFPSDNNKNNDVFASIKAHDTDYHILRRIQWDISSKLEANSTVGLKCEVMISAHIFHTLQTTYTIPLSSKYYVSDFQSVSKVYYKDGKKILKKKSKSHVPSVSFKNTHLSKSHVAYDVIVELKNHGLSFNGDKFNSFMIHVPPISYVTSLIEKSGEDNRYLQFQTGAFSFDLTDYHTPVSIELDIRCMAPAHSVAEAIARTNEQCTLLSSLGAQKFYEELMANKFVNITAHSTHKNFLSMFLGEIHYVRSIDASKFPYNQQRDMKATTFVQEGYDDTRSLTSSYDATDPAISTGADCVTVDSDGVYISQMCSVVEKGFFKLYVGIYNDDDMSGYLKSVTSWAPSGEVAFDSELEGELTTGGNNYNIIGNLFFSENFKNLTGLVGLNCSNTQTFLETFSAYWDFGKAYSTGIIDAYSLTLIDGMQPIKGYGMLEYMAQVYSGKLLLTDSPTKPLGETLTATAAGSYGGDWYQWFISLNESTIMYNSSIGHIEDHATGLLTYAVPKSGTNGQIKLSSQVVNSYDEYVFQNNGLFYWLTGSSWDSFGTIFANSEVMIYNTSYNWNTTGSMAYGNNEYQISVFENDYGMNAATTNYVENEFCLVGAGEYGGSDGYHWWGTLAFSDLVWNYKLLGSASGGLLFDVEPSGVLGNLQYYGNISSNTRALYLSNQSVTWATIDGWLLDGSFDVKSQSMLDEFVNWNVNGMFNYGTNQYTIMISESNYDSDEKMFLISGAGNYGGDWQEWYASLTQSTLIISNDLLGHAIGMLQYTSDNNGSNANITYTSFVTDGNDSTVLISNDRLMYQTESTWNEMGSIALYSSWDLVDIVVFNVSGDLKYANDMYTFSVSETDYHGNTQNSVMVYGNGQYGGSWGGWFATLSNAYCYYNNTLYGTAQGEVTGVTPKTWEHGVVVYHATAKDSNGIESITTFGNSTWQTNTDWIDDALITQSSDVWVKDTINWNESLVFQYGDNAYRLSVQETALVENATNSGVVPETFTTYFEGGYGSAGYNEGWLSVTNSLIEVDQTVYLNMRAYLSGAYSYSGENLAVVANFVDYTGEDPSATYQISETYPVGDSYLWTENKLTYYYDGDQTGGYIATNTSWYSNPMFSLQSLFNLSFVEESAYFMVYETLYGKDGLDAWGAADYNLATGMIADIGGEVSYADSLIVGFNTAYDMQLETLDSFPTMSPTIVPTNTPTIIPSFEPTFEPSTANPTAIPGTPTHPPTGPPTATPTFDPTQDPTATPTVVPSPLPSYPPSVAPSPLPTATPTAEPTTAGPTTGPGEPSSIPTFAPTIVPSETPTENPTFTPTFNPTELPTEIPSYTPTNTPLPTVTPGDPTPPPTRSPTAAPSVSFTPTFAPTKRPFVAPTVQPSIEPTFQPTFNPSAIPTRLPFTPKSFSPSFAPTTTFPTESPTTLTPTVSPTTNTPTTTLQPTYDGSVFSNGAATAAAYEMFEGTKIIAFLLPPVIIMASTLLAIHFRKDHEDDLNKIGSSWITTMTSAITSLTWVGVVNSFFEAVGSELIYDRMNVILLAIAKGCNVIGWCYVIYHFIFTRMNSSGVRKPPLYFLLNDVVIKETTGAINGKMIMSIMFTAALMDPLQFKLLPWKKTEHTEKAEGYPCLTVIYGCLYFPLMGSILQMFGTLMLVISQGGPQFITNLILFILSALLTIYHGAGVFTMVFLVKADKLQNLVVVDVNDVVSTQGISIGSWTSAGPGLEMSRFSSRTKSKTSEKSDTHYQDNPLRKMKELQEELELERRLRYAVEEQHRALSNKRQNLDSQLFETEADKKKKEEKINKDLDILSSQLTRHGLQALRYIPLEEIRAEMSQIFANLNEGKEYDERRLDYLLACLEINPDFIKEKELETKSWIQSVRGFIDESYETMLGFIPPNIFSITLPEMIAEGLPKALAQRFQNKKCLWLIRLDKADLQKLHEAELMGRFNPDGQNLDVVEVAAIYSAVPEKFLNDPFGRKQRWKERLEAILKQMVTDKQNGKLTKAKERFSAYKNVTPPYVGRATMHFLHAVKAAENLG